MDEPIWKEQTKEFIAAEEIKAIRRNRGAHRARSYFRQLAGLPKFGGTVRTLWTDRTRRLQAEARRIEDGFDLWLGEPQDVDVPDEYFRSLLPDVWEIDRCKRMESEREPEATEPPPDHCPFCDAVLQPDARCDACTGPPEPGEGVVYQPSPYELQEHRRSLIANALKALAEQPGRGGYVNRNTPYHHNREIEQNLATMQRWVENAKLHHVRLMSHEYYDDETCEPLYWSRAAGNWVPREQGDIMHRDNVAHYTQGITGPWEAVLYVPPDATFPLPKRGSKQKTTYQAEFT